MSRQDRSEDAISMGELSDLLTDAEGMDRHEFDRRAEEFDIGPPEEADVVSE